MNIFKITLAACLCALSLNSFASAFPTSVLMMSKGKDVGCVELPKTLAKIDISSELQDSNADHSQITFKGDVVLRLTLRTGEVVIIRGQEVMFKYDAHSPSVKNTAPEIPL